MEIADQGRLACGLPKPAYPPSLGNSGKGSEGGGEISPDKEILRYSNIYDDAANWFDLIIILL